MKFTAMSFNFKKESLLLMSVQLLTLLSVYVKEQRDCAFYSLDISRGVPMKMCQGY